jgi:hypothetical protein
MHHSKIVDADVCELWTVGYLADGPNAGRARLKVLVHLDVTADAG